MITGINESKVLIKHILCECKCKFDGRNCNQINGRIMINVNLSVKNVTYVKKKKEYIWNPATCNCENGKFLASIVNDSTIMCDEIIEETVPTNLNENKANFYILLAFLLITIALSIAVSIYCYLIKC